ncbi:MULTISPECIES: SulP family inorganic anion transporter [unclassified Serratia (in: enterobacteria)]|uniref:SulP family inorganic anion transporter n=1 Tax=unclassified Serratia (in: enterobacteria) TaxID=2647522 RepID=UPI0004FF8F6D|nr:MULTISPECIES: SulP family inorganic anion transporter [unclassified Serratia (in: enterobacteria)]KFK92414.1 sulfate permease [Serratia sp. Ag2]KFK98492.1 sulfate permease [Serratia sp. Ag1]
MNMNKGFSGDLFGGLTAAIVALPLALAFGVQSGMGPVAGLYGAIALGILAALFGGTRTQISGPTGPMTVVSSAIVAAEIAYFGSLEAALPSIVVTFVLAGVLQIFMGMLRVGQYIRYMPYPVISGFMSGIGLIIIITQLFPLMGLSSPGSPLATLLSLGGAIGKINLQALFLAAGTIATIYLFPKITKTIPATLVALILFTLLSILLKLQVPTIGDIPQGLPKLHLSAFFEIEWHDPAIIIFTALTLASLGAIDSLLTSVVADNMTRTQHNSNRELIGQGIGNAVAGLFGGLPGAGATIRTVVNIRSGGHSRLSGITHGVILLFILLGAGKYAGLIPVPVLAGILITVGIGIIDYRSLRGLRSIPRADVVIMLSVTLLTVFVDLLQAVGIGMVMAALWFMKQMSDLTEEKSQGHLLATDKRGVLADEQAWLRGHEEQVYIQHFDGPIFFGFIFGFNRIIREMPEVKTVIFRMENVPYIDQSGLYAFEDAISSLRQKGIEIMFCALQAQPRGMLERIGLIPNLVSTDKIFERFEDLVPLD